MSRSLITPAHRVAPRVRVNRLVATGLAVVVTAAGAVFAFPGKDPVLPARPDAEAAAPIIFGDPPVAKGAQGSRPDRPPPPVFGDPQVRKGAGGR